MLCKEGRSVRIRALGRVLRPVSAERRNGFCGVLVVGLIGLSVTVDAQLTVPSFSGEELTGLVMTSMPSGSEIELWGDIEIKGRTPFSTTNLPTGRYHIKVWKKGYECRECSVDLEPGERLVLAIELKPKDRWNAALRSAIVPGWGQRYSERSAEGWMVTIGELAAVSVMGYWWWRYSETIDDYDMIRWNYEQAHSIAEIERYKQELLDLHQISEDQYQYMEQAALVAGGLWAFGLLRSLLFLPAMDRSEEGAIGELPEGFHMGASDGRVTVGVVARF